MLDLADHHDGRDRDFLLKDIASIVADEAIGVGESDLSRLFTAVADPYARGRIVARMPGASEYVKTHRAALPVSLDMVYMEIASAAEQTAPPACLRPLVDMSETPEAKAAILLHIGRALAATDPSAAKDALAELIVTAASAKVARVNRLAQEGALDDKGDDSDGEIVETYDRQAFPAVIALGRLDPEAALGRLDTLSAWRKGFALAEICAIPRARSGEGSQGVERRDRDCRATRPRQQLLDARLRRRVRHEHGA